MYVMLILNTNSFQLSLEKASDILLLFHLAAVNTANFSKPISQVPTLFKIHHLLGVIRDTFSYNLYTELYLQ